MTKAAAKTTTDTPEIKQSTTLPIGVLIKGVRYKEVEVRPITLGQSYEASMTARENDLQVLVDLSVMTYVPQLDRHLTYDEVDSLSRQDGQRLEQARMMMEKKERDAASTSS